MLKLFHPLADMRFPYCIHVPFDVHNAYLHGCKDGWLLMSTDLYSVYFYNPLSRFTIPLPELPSSYEGEVYGFTCTSAPTAKDCIALVTTHRSYDSRIDKIFTIAKGRSDWTMTSCNPICESVSPCHQNPVYHKGKFYFMSYMGELGVFDPNTQSWMLYDVQNDPKKYLLFDEGYLLDFDGDLTSVFISKKFRIAVFRWDECKLNWQAVTDVGDYTFFLSNKTSFAKKDKRCYMRNKIYFPIKYKNYGLFCSLPLDSLSYQTCQHDLGEDDQIAITHIWKCCWFEPAQHHCSNKLLEWISNTKPDDC